MAGCGIPEADIAAVLKIDPNYLHYLAGKVPDDIRRMNLSAEEVKAAFTAFRKRK